MSSRQLDEERIFHIARKLTDADVQADYLDQICAGDQALRERVEALLRAHEQAEQFLRSGQPEPAPTVESTPLTERPGTMIGRYRLMEQIGEGGMGTVFVAEQDRPIRRKVAVKVIKPGMDSKDVVARFEAERQALALMDHPNIAKVLDAGNTETGRPYFVMEFVRGISITEYCDGNKLSVKERLQLFVQVCYAVQHAHQKGIIHRDLKPSNVLVTLHDGEPVPKIIDFGIAKALNQRLTDRTIYTRVHQAIGTLAYMSPEQAELSGLDVDTRTDVYGLGVLLYELLTGSTPFDTKRLNEAAFHEACRIIREEEPPRASTKVSSLGATATAVSEQRKTVPQDLARQLHGDLDWILVKALEKDRTHRYESASAFAADAQHYLDNEPIDARPPSTTYRLRKFVSRHRTALAAMTAVITALVVGLVSTTWMAILFRSNLRDLQATSREQAFVAALLGDTENAVKGLMTARRVGDSTTELRVLEGLIALNNGDYNEAIAIAQEVLGKDEEHIGALALLASAQCWGGELTDSVMHMNRLAKLEPEAPTDHLLMAHALALYDSGLALQHLEATKRMYHSPIGLLLRGQDYMFRGEDTQVFALFKHAAQDFAYVHFLLPDNPSAVIWQAEALARTIEFARNRGYEHEEFVAEGRRILEELPTNVDGAFVNEASWMLRRALGDDDGATNAIRRAGKHGIFCFFVAVDVLSRPDSFPDAEMAFRDATLGHDENDPYLGLARAFIIHDRRDGGQEIQEAAARLTQDKDNAVDAMLALCALCLAGDLNLVQKFAIEAVRQDAPGIGRFANKPCVEFLANPPSTAAEEELLRTTNGHVYAAINAHFTIGMARLAAHDRDGAIQHFEKCTATTAVGNLSYEMARAFLLRMKSNPAWPSWLPAGAAN